MDDSPYEYKFSLDVYDDKGKKKEEKISGINYVFFYRNISADQSKPLFVFSVSIGENNFFTKNRNFSHKVSIKIIRVIKKNRPLIVDQEITFHNEKLVFDFITEFKEDELKKYFKQKKKMMLEITIKHDSELLEECKRIKAETGYVGIVNDGCTCYMNSLLQMFYHIPIFRKLIYSFPPETEGKQILLNLQRLFTMLTLSPTAPKTEDLIKSFGWTGNEAFEQHDVQEFARLLIDVVEEKFNKSPFKGEIEKLMCGELITTIQCLNIDYKSVTKEKFYDISLLVKDMNCLEDSLRNFISNSDLVGDNKYRLDNGNYEDAFLYTKFAVLPPILQLHLQRIDYDSFGYTRKLKNEYGLPLSIDLSPYCEESQEEKIYDLYSILLHLGNYESSGHYIAFIKKDDQWLSFDDSYVSKVDEEEVLNRSKEDSYYLCYLSRAERERLLDSNFNLPDHLNKYYEENKPDKDLKMVCVTVENYDKTFVIGKEAKIRSIIKNIVSSTDRNIKYDVWKGRLFPEYKLELNDKFEKHFSTSANVFLIPSTQDSKDGRPIEIHVLNKSPKRLYTYGYEVCNLKEKLGDFIKRVFKYHQSFNIFDLARLKPVNENKCIEEIYEEVGRRILVEPENDIEIIRNKIMNDNTYLYTSDYNSNTTVESKYSLENLIETQRQLIECRVTLEMNGTVNEEVIKIKTPPDTKVSEIANCIAKFKNIPDDKGIALYSNNKSIQILNDIQNPYFKDSFKYTFDGTKYYQAYAKIKPYNQQTIQNLFSKSIDVYDEKLIKIKTINYEAPSTKSVGELLEYIGTDISSQNLRLMILDRQTIRFIAPNDYSLSQIGEYLRVEKIPEDQLNISDDQKLIKCAFVTMESNIIHYSVFKPFILAINKDDDMDKISSKIVSKQLCNNCNIEKYFISSNSLSTSELNESDKPFELMGENDTLCCKIDFRIYHNSLYSKGPELKIYK